MSESHYYLRAILPVEKGKETQLAIAKFIQEVYVAHNFWNKNRERAETDEFKTELSINFPTVAKYINSLNLPQPYTPNALCGTLMWGDPNYHEEDIVLSDDGTRFKWSSKQSCFLNLDGVVEFIKKEFNAIDVRWTSEELLDAWDFMDNEDGGEILQAILNMDKEDLAAFIHIHPILDNYISAKLAEDDSE